MRDVKTQAGLYPGEIHKGTLIDGRRVEKMTTGLLNGQPIVTVWFAEVNKRGRNRLSPPVTYRLGGPRVPGTRTSTTWAMPAGPVGRKPGTQLNGGWWGDGDATDRGARTDRHHRMIEAVTYA